MVTDFGPSIWKVTGSDGLVVPAASGVGSPSFAGPPTYIFPRRTFIVGVLVLMQPLTGPYPDLASQHAQIALSIIDEVNQPIVSDSRGTVMGTNLAPVAAPLVALQGRGFQPYALQRPVDCQDQWIFSLQNSDTARAMTCAGIFLYIGPNE